MLDRMSKYPKEIFENRAGVNRGRLAEELALSLLPGASNMSGVWTYGDILYKKEYLIEVKSKMGDENFPFTFDMYPNVDANIFIVFDRTDDGIYAFFVPAIGQKSYGFSKGGERWNTYQVNSPADVDRLIEFFKIKGVYGKKFFRELETNHFDYKKDR